jgi:mRNA-degrading endonuclease YafQ of YafQ-DinJ toxin-antitoxin module
MKIQFTPRFERCIKKLHPNEVLLLNQAIKTIANNPLAGEAKKGDLVGVRVYKYHHIQQQLLLAYLIDNANDQIILMGHGSHENFYRDLKKQLTD